MIVKIIWTLIGLNTLALFVFIIAYFSMSNGRNVDILESDWTILMVGIGLGLILLMAVPIWRSHSTLSLVISGFFSLLPLMIYLGILISNKLPQLKSQQTFAEIYYKDKSQRRIAAAIENNDFALVEQLIKGQDLNIQGTKVWDWPGLNYLQFTVRLRSNAQDFPYNEQVNDSIIRLLIANGSAVTPALSEAVKYVSAQLISEMIDAGADPNTGGFVNADPVIFQLISGTKKEIDMAILLVRKGANINTKNNQDLTPVMYAAYNADTKSQWSDAWRLVLYLLEGAGADYKFTNRDGLSLTSIIQKISIDAKAQHVTMSDDFLAVVEWLNVQNQ